MRKVRVCALCRKETNKDEYHALVSNGKETKCVSQSMEGKSRLIYNDKTKTWEPEKKHYEDTWTWSPFKDESDEGMD
jgi:hypothetical protein